MPTVPSFRSENPIKPKGRNRRKRKPWRDLTPEQKHARRDRYQANRRVRDALYPQEQVAPDVAKQQLAGDKNSLTQFKALDIAIRRHSALSQQPGNADELRGVESVIQGLLGAMERSQPLKQGLRMTFRKPRPGSKKAVDKPESL